MTRDSELNFSGRLNSAGNPVWMDGLRVLLGLFLFLKGLLFLEYNSEIYYALLTNPGKLAMGNAHLLTSMVHMLGGLMISAGCLTRFALLCQFPIVIGTMLLIGPQSNSGIDYLEIGLSLLIIGLLLFFMIVGPGRYSVDNKLFRRRPLD